MNMQTVRDNLKTTIAGKEKMLAEYRNARENNALAQTPDEAIYATVAFLEINLAELKRILQDVEQCIPSESTKERDMMKGLWKV